LIESRKIGKFVERARDGEIEIFLEGGEKKVEKFLVHKPLTRLNKNWVGQLGLEVTPPLNETSVRGVLQRAIVDRL
jgi:acylphosphatase